MRRGTLAIVTIQEREHFFGVVARLIEHRPPKHIVFELIHLCARTLIAALLKDAAYPIFHQVAHISGQIEIVWRRREEITKVGDVL